VSDAGRSTSPPAGSRSTIEAITWAYVEAAGGDVLAALRLAVADALSTIAEMDRRARQAERMVSRGFIRAGASASHRGAL
jgi:hypothetical protein